MKYIKQKIWLKYKISTFIFVSVICSFASTTYATCTSTIINESPNSSSTMVDTADNQCVINAGTITSPGFIIDSYYSNPTIINSGSIVINSLTPGDSAGITLNGPDIAGRPSTNATILNSGNITASTDNDIYAIWIYNNVGTVANITNSGLIQLTGAGQKVGIFNYAGNDITTLTNSGNISVSGSIAAIANNSTITSLNNSGTIVSGGSAQGILNNAGANIRFLSNTGTISTQAGQYGILNSGTINTLSNAQGGNGTSPATTALTYQGNLPTNYNIIINSATHYGQLAVTNPSGTITNFGISGSPLITARIYSEVLIGSAEPTGVKSGTYDNMSWELVSAGAGVYDLTFTGASLIGTQHSLVNTVNALAPVYALQNSVLSDSFDYDCPVFGQNNVCVSTGGRNTAVSNANGLNSTSALLIGAYRLMPTVRIGAYVDQNLSVSNQSSTVSLGNGAPLIGLFGVWSQRVDGAGAEVKVSAAYGRKSVTINRQVVGLSEPGSGSSNLNSQGAQMTAKYGFAVMPEVIVSPYVGMRYTQNSMGGYTEATSSSVTGPLSYSALKTSATTFLLGVGTTYQYSPKATVFANAGLEMDINVNNGQYSASGIIGLTSVNFNANPVKTKPTATLGTYFDIEKNHRFGITGIYSKEAFQEKTTTAILAIYTVGL
jgi:hypothetical protein